MEGLKMTNYDSFSHGYKGLFDCTYSELVPADNDVDAQCMSYAVYMSMQVIRKYSERICIFSNIDNLPESVLDYLAIEWRVPYYENDFDMDTKRNLLKKGFLWDRTAGTVGGMEELLETLFRSGTVVEWFNFDDGEQVPGQFDVQINDNVITSKSLDELNRILKKIKNVRSHLRKIIANYDAEHELQFINRNNAAVPIILLSEEV
jgi:phage tail P2-like protein